MNGEKLKSQLNINIDSQFLQQALYHSSYLNEKKRTDEIEIQKSYIHMGKLIYHLALASLISEEETKQHKEINEKLTQYKDEILLQFYDENKINDLLFLGRGELSQRKERYLEHCLIIFYYIYRENGLDRLRTILSPLYKKGKKVDKLIDYKSALQEYIQDLKLTTDNIKYETISVEGPKHDCYYTVKVSVNGLSGVGKAKTKKNAQQQAAQNLFKNNKVSISKKPRNKSVQPAKKVALVLTKNREDELLPLYKTLKISTNDISLKNLDICFTHKSFANEKKLNTMEAFSFYAWLGALVIPCMIGEYILQEFQTRASGKYSRLMELTSSLVSKNHLSKCLPTSIYKSVRIPNKNDLNAPSLRADIVQTLVAAMFLENLEHQNDKTFENIKEFVRTYIISTNKKDSISVDYRSYLQIVTQELNIETKAKIATSGLSHQLKHNVKVSTFFANGEKFLEGRGKATSKKQSVNLACKEIIDQMIYLYNLNHKKLELPNTTILNQTLAYYIRNALNSKNPLKFLDLVGGLGLNRWSLATAMNIATHLYNRGLISELLMVLIKWEKLYSSESVEKCIRELPDSGKKVILSKWQETNKRREQIKNKTAQNEENQMEDEFLLLFEEFNFKPVKDTNRTIGNIGVRESQNEDDRSPVRAIQVDDEDFEEIDDLFNFKPFS
ncbi:putative dsRNA-binding protein [Bacillus sp. S/N-304-OC-R1]|uniref:putative dsRNA-binding protein n=1 Tax=Bacillus sp. S/N-304-OC-R1 TaxID=2758034 RepID=UPI001C8E7B1F|nr:putative dsRNA-binding protein [Bacillus sp. S/N-304-OC-R1]MBY0124395.1 hypothetical protein [Bacillus sp. S/N-304-OC-R1]